MFKRNCLSVQHDITLKKLVETVLQTKSKYDEFGLTLVKKENKFVGLISRGDFISLLYRDECKSMQIHDLMNKNPIVFTIDSPFENGWYQELYDFLIKLKKVPTIIPVINRKGEIISAIDAAAFLASRSRVTKIAVYGLGFVGLTLAVALANSGFLVTGIDSNQNLIDNLINPILQEINKHIFTTNSITLFSSIYDSNIEMVNLDYNLYIHDEYNNMSNFTNIKNSICIIIFYR